MSARCRESGPYARSRCTVMPCFGATARSGMYTSSVFSMLPPMSLPQAGPTSARRCCTCAGMFDTCANAGAAASSSAKDVSPMTRIRAVREVALHRDALLRRDGEERHVHLERLLDVAADVLAPGRTDFCQALLHVRRHVRYLRERRRCR